MDKQKWKRLTKARGHVNATSSRLVNTRLGRLQLAFQSVEYLSDELFMYKSVECLEDPTADF